VSTVVLADGKLEIPTNVRSQLHLQDGDTLEIEVTHGAILLRPLDTLSEEERFHIRRGLADIAAGRVREVAEEDLLALIDPADRP
jgi:AbrB family looped-hinge helix DNA binding protein